MRLLGRPPLLLALQATAAYAAKGVCTDGVTGCEVDFQCRGCNTKSDNRGHPCASDDDCQGSGDAKCSGSAFVGSGACAIIAEAVDDKRGVCIDGVTGCDVDFQCRGCNTKSDNRGSPCASDDDCHGNNGDAKCSGSAFVGSGACAITAEAATPPPTPATTRGVPHAIAAEVGKVKQTDIRSFEILTSEQIHTTLGYLAEEYPNFVTLTDSQTEYGLRAAGTEDDCRFDQAGDGCRNYILTIEDKVAHPVGSPSWSSLPEVLLVGAMHGNERLGPTTILEVASLVLEAASCESISTSDADPEVAFAAAKCREDLSDKGVPDLQRKWLARLVTTRRIVMVPMANALGYHRNERDEDGTDPNGDFPFDYDKAEEDAAQMCMRTVASRTVNEVFREHMFRLGVAFHSGGTANQAITYEWGATRTYSRSISPDDEAQAEIAKGLSDIAGRFNDVPSYLQGARNDIASHGGRGEMEDWAYAGSWDPERVVQCNPTEYGGYPREKTVYDESMLRTLMMRVECSNENSPDDLGTTEDLLYVEAPGNGHIARNIKLSLLAIELVDPYVSIVGADGVLLTDDIVPSTDRAMRACEKTKALLIPEKKAEIDVEWTVGGGFTVDTSHVFHFKWVDLPESFDGSTQPTEEEWQSLGDMVAAAQVSPSRGMTKWQKDGATPYESSLHPLASFNAKIDLSKYSPGDRVAMFAVAKLDSRWMEDQPANAKPVVPPQSHIVNARTNPGWRHETSGKVIQGRFNFYSIPLTLVVGGEGDDATAELSIRLNGVSSELAGIGTASGGEEGGSSSSMYDRLNEEFEHLELLLAAVAFAVLVLFAGFIVWWNLSAWAGKDTSNSGLVEMDFNQNLAPRRSSGDALSFMDRVFDEGGHESIDFNKDHVMIDDSGGLRKCDLMDISSIEESSGNHGDEHGRSLSGIFWDR